MSTFLGLVRMALILIVCASPAGASDFLDTVKEELTTDPSLINQVDSAEASALHHAAMGASALPPIWTATARCSPGRRKL